MRAEGTFPCWTLAMFTWVSSLAFDLHDLPTALPVWPLFFSTLSCLRLEVSQGRHLLLPPSSPSLPRQWARLKTKIYINYTCMIHTVPALTSSIFFPHSLHRLRLVRKVVFAPKAARNDASREPACTVLQSLEELSLSYLLAISQLAGRSGLFKYIYMYITRADFFFIRLCRRQFARTILWLRFSGRWSPATPDYHKANNNDRQC